MVHVKHSKSNFEMCIPSYGVKLEIYISLSHYVASGSDPMPACNKIHKPLVVYRLVCNVMMSIITLRKRWQKSLCDFKVILTSSDK